MSPGAVCRLDIPARGARTHKQGPSHARMSIAARCRCLPKARGPECGGLRVNGNNVRPARAAR